MPLAANRNYRELILELLRKYRVSLWIPILDEEIVEAAEIQESKDGRIFAAFKRPRLSWRNCVLTSSKWRAGSKAKAFRRQKPRFWSPCRGGKGGWFVKPRRGRGSNGARLLSDKAAFEYRSALGMRT